jgi:N-acetylmuramoyl-L-alanine amidase CwlA
MKINKKITKVNRTVMSNKKNKYLVIHYVGAVSTAKNNASYFYSTNRGASAHYFVDDNEIWQVVEDKDAAWHCGTSKTYYHKECRNNNSIGIEMCCIKVDGKLDMSEKTISNTIELTKELMAKYNIPITNVIRHYDVTHKTCPAPFVKDTARWNDFKNRLVDAPDTEFTAGQKVVLNNVPLYASSTTTKVSSYKTGTYYLWSNKVTNGRIRITNKSSNVGVSGQVTGWVNAKDLRN